MANNITLTDLQNLIVRKQTSVHEQKGVTKFDIEMDFHKSRVAHFQIAVLSPP